MSRKIPENLSKHNPPKIRLLTVQKTKNKNKKDKVDVVRPRTQLSFVILLFSSTSLDQSFTESFDGKSKGLRGRWEKWERDGILRLDIRDVIVESPLGPSCLPPSSHSSLK